MTEIYGNVCLNFIQNKKLSKCILKHLELPNKNGFTQLKNVFTYNHILFYTPVQVKWSISKSEIEITGSAPLFFIIYLWTLYLITLFLLYLILLVFFSLALLFKSSHLSLHLQVQVAEAKITHVIQLKHTLDLVPPLRVCTCCYEMYTFSWKTPLFIFTVPTQVWKT